MGEEKKNRIVLTGFGPFSTHKVNDSWVIAKKLKDTDFENELDVILEIREIPVTYVDSQEIVQKIWSGITPCLVIHTGVHNEDHVLIEKKAGKIGYCKPDQNNCLLNNQVCPIVGEEEICTGIDLERLLKSLRADEVPVKISENAGKYLCEYTYYMSLSKNKNRVLFIHVPPSASTVSVETKVRIVKEIMKNAYLQLTGKDNN